MNDQVTEVISQVLPPWNVTLRLLLILLVAALVRIRASTSPERQRRRPAWRALAARVAPSATVLLLTAGAVAIGPPWGFDVARDAARQHAAWILYWFVVLAVALIDGAVDLFYRHRDTRHPVPLLLRRGLILALYVGAALGLLRYYLDADITPLLATSAIVTMVVGLALQGTLGNLLSGVSLSLVRSVEVGDLIGVRNVEGIVIRTNWRETILRTRDHDFVHVPNNVLAGDMLTNFSKPSALHRHTIDVGASYSDAPAGVIAELVAAAREAEITLDHPAPVAHVIAFLDFGINYRLLFFSESYWTRAAVEGEVARRIWYRFKRKGIEIPFPMSDQLLNDFMAVVYNQRRLPPEAADVERMVRLLRGSDFLVRRSGSGGEGTPADVAPATEAKPILDDDALRELASACRIVRYTAGEVLCRQGDPGSACYLVETGSIKGDIEYREKGATHHQEFVAAPGSLFGEMSLFAGTDRTATGHIAEETSLLEIPGDAFARLLGRHERIIGAIADLVAERNRDNAAFLEKIASLPAGDLERSCDAGRIRARLQGLAAWGRKLIAGS